MIIMTPGWRWQRARRGKVSSRKGPSASSDFPPPSSRGVSLVRGHLSRIPCQGEPLPDPSSGGVSKCFVLSSKSVRGTQTVHLKKTNSDFLIPMILYFPVHKAVLNFYLKPLSIIKVCNSENIVVNCRYYRFWNCL